jgi:hypothetical protein
MISVTLSLTVTILTNVTIPLLHSRNAAPATCINVIQPTRDDNLCLTFSNCDVGAVTCFLF